MIRGVVFLPLLVACAPAPLSPEQAARACEVEVDRNDGVSGNVGIGIGTDGPTVRTGIRVTNEIFDRRSRDEKLAACIARRTTGQPAPTTFGVTLGGRL